MTLTQILKRTPGTILNITFTYDIINFYQAELTANDSNPETGYFLYINKERFKSRQFNYLMSQITMRLKRENLLV